MTTRRRRRTHLINEIREMGIGCIGGYALFLGISPSTANGTIGLFLIGGAVISGILYSIIEVQNGKNILRSVIEIITIFAISFVLVYGCIWYFTVHLAAQPNLFNF
nr:hypothetical protein [Oscillochloris trichoides]